MLAVSTVKSKLKKQKIITGIMNGMLLGGSAGVGKSPFMIYR
jgi:hypothetical protein